MRDNAVDGGWLGSTEEWNILEVERLGFRVKSFLIIVLRRREPSTRCHSLLIRLMRTRTHQRLPNLFPCQLASQIHPFSLEPIARNSMPERERRGTNLEWIFLLHSIERGKVQRRRRRTKYGRVLDGVRREWMKFAPVAVQEGVALRLEGTR